MRRYILYILLCFHLQGYAQLELAPVFTDHMVLQRERPVCIWGRGTPGLKLQVKFGKISRTGFVLKDSTWKFYFPSQKANAVGQQLTVSSPGINLTINDILMGDLWLCIGQSNMEFPMVREMYYKQEIKESVQPLLRFYDPGYIGKNVFKASYTDSMIKRLNLNDLFSKVAWQVSDSFSFKAMSAVAYYFGKDIILNTGIPVGLINLSIGGCPLETFIDTKVMLANPAFKAKCQGNWLDNDALPVWIRQRGKENIANLPGVPSDEYGPFHSYKPGVAYQAGIAPLLSMPIKGIICYQGESNAQEMERVNEYAELSRLMVEDFRRKWKDPRMPFYYVQLSSIDTPKYKGQLWPDFRNEQRKMLSLIPFSGMAVCSDIGALNDVHPVNKKWVGQRLARWALAKNYNKNILPSGPLPITASYNNGLLSIRFSHTGNNLNSFEGETLRGFSLDGIKEVPAKITGDSVLIETTTKPSALYYGWSPFSKGNLVNADNLPASTFKLTVK